MTIESKSEEGKINPNVVTVIVAAIFVLALVVGILYYNSPKARTTNLISKAGQSIDEGDYDNAVSDLKNAYAIDPENEEANEIINSYLILMLDKAEDTANPEKKKWIASFVASFDSDLPVFSDSLARAEELSDEADRKIISEPFVKRAEALFDKGDYDAADKEYAAAIEKGAKETDLGSSYELNSAYLKLREMAAEPDRTGIIDYLNSVSSDCIKKKLDEKRTLDLSDERYLVVSKRDDAYLMIYGSLDDNRDGCAAGIISGADYNALYEGEWKNGKPDGYGKVIVWDKNKNITDSYTMSGTLEKGYFTGDMIYESKDIEPAVIHPDERITPSAGDETDAETSGEDGAEAKNNHTAGVPLFGDDANDRNFIREAKVSLAEKASAGKAEKKSKQKTDEKEETAAEERKYPGVDLFDVTIWPVENTPFEFDGADLKAGTLAAGTPAKIVAESGDRFYVRVGDKKGFVDRTVCLINLPDIMQKEMQYNITNSYCSIYKINGKRIRNVTGEIFYPNVKSGEDKYLVPLLYPVVMKLYDAEEDIIKQGYTFRIYDTYQPGSVSKTIYSETSEYLKGEDELKAFITDGGYKLTDFIPDGVSDHNYGTALDITLADLETGEEIAMQTPVHELGPDSVTDKNTPDTDRLRLCLEKFGFTGAEKKWWHFDLVSAHKGDASFQTIPYSESSAR